MAPSNELDYLKSLVAQLNDKINALEAKAKSSLAGTSTPAQQLRTILIGPPGAGVQTVHIIVLCLTFGRREGDAGSEDSRQILHMSPGYWRHVAGADCAENSSRS
jgi:hypothetical protein